MDADKRLWLKRLWSLNTLLLLSWFVITFCPDSWEPYPTYIFWCIVGAFIYWLTWEGMYQFRLARLPVMESVPAMPSQQPLAKESATATSKRPEISPGPYLDRLSALIETEDIHLRPDLSREWVAERLDISPGYLSQLINGSTGQNFSSYINAHRVEAVKRMLLDPEFAKYSVMAIGQEAGFSSKSAFYSSFKKATGMTPSAYQKQGAMGADFSDSKE